MATLRPDPTFYPSAKQAAEAPPRVITAEGGEAEVAQAYPEIPGLS